MQVSLTIFDLDRPPRSLSRVALIGMTSERSLLFTSCLIGKIIMFSRIDSHLVTLPVNIVNRQRPILRESAGDDEDRS